MASRKLARINYAVRTGAFAYCFVTIGVHLSEHGAGWVAWSLLAAQFLVYPHVVFWRAMLSPKPNRAERDNLFLDSALLGAWAASLGFPLWISYDILGAALLNTAINRGAAGMLWAVLCAGAGAVFWGLIGGFSYHPETSSVVTLLCVLGATIYFGVVSFVVYHQTRRLADARRALAKSEQRYRLIAENAADLIAMVDHDSGWLYTSPSYATVLSDADLAPGADAFRRAHPDDAEQARIAVRRAAVSGKPRDLALRLVDRDGRVRQYKTHVHAVAGGPSPGGVVLVSHDVTDLRASEERVLLAAHALEGMTEAIMITGADGTVLTVNRAFCELTGYTRDDVLGQPEKSLRNALQAPAFYDEMFAAVQSSGYWSGTTWSRRKNGSVYREWRSVRAVREASAEREPKATGRITHYVMLFYELGSGQGRPENAARPA
ncbi:MAG TPA: PAS domain S-box protein [Burkholderiales bacterium]|nr:PAS domain S-box protein [Burkholderiales bacterium]